MPEATTVALRCRGIEPRYGAIRVARHVSLEVRSGEVLALLGPNGAGKSSTVECLAGRVEGAGEVMLGDVELTGLPAYRRARRGLALVPENRGLFGDLTVEDNLWLGAQLERDGRPSIDRAIKLFPVLGDRTRQRASTLSGGEQQMLAFGRAVVSSPDVLILDEPTQGLAPTILDALLEAIAVLRGDGLAILLVEQNVSFAASAADRYQVLSGGRIVDAGDRSQLTNVEGIFEKYVAG